MAIKPAGTAVQTLTWRTAPTLEAKTGQQTDFDLKSFVNDPYNGQRALFFSLVPTYTYPAGWSQLNGVGGVRATGATVVAEKTLQWNCTPQGKGTVRSPPGWVRTVAAAVEVPSAPANVQAQATGPTTVVVTWAPGASGSTVTAFRVYYSDTGTSPYTELTPAITPPAANTKTDSTLAPNQTRWYMVVAQDANGATTQSVTDDATTPFAVPGVPLNVTATPTANSIVLDWDANTLGTAPTFYRVRVSQTGVDLDYVTLADVVPPTTTYTHAGLSAGDTRYYRIRPFDAAGGGDASEPVSATIAIPLGPKTPINLAAEPLGAHTTQLTWAAGMGGTTITEYRLWRALDQAGPYATAGTLVMPATLEKTDSGLDESTRYWYRVSAWDGTTESERSVADDALTHTISPTTPTVVSVLPLAAAPQTTLQIKWQAGSGGATPAKYHVFRSTTETGTYAQIGAAVNAPTTQIDDATLAAAQTRWYKVKALDAMDDESPLSAPKEGTTAATAVPGIPATPGALPLSTTAIRVSWTQGSGSTPTGYRVYRSATSGGTFSPLHASTDDSPYDDGNLQPATPYYYKIAALDSAQSFESNKSVTASATTNPVPSTGVRFAPGHYIRPGLGDPLGTASDTGTSTILGKINNYDSRVRGIIYLKYWKDIETTKGVINFANHDAVAARCEDQGKVYMFRVQDRAFNGTDPLRAVPAYIKSEGYTYVRAEPVGNQSAGAALWRAQCMTYLIGVYKRLIDRYRNRPGFVGTIGEESIYGGAIPSNYPDYNAAGYCAQEVRRMQEIRNYASHLPYCLYSNGFSVLDTASGNKALLDWYAAVRADLGSYTCGGPDMNSNNGWDAAIGDFPGSVDHRGDYLMLGSTESSDGTDAAPIYATAVTTRKCNIMSWSTNNSGWANNFYPYIQSHPTTQTVPSAMVGRVTVM